MRPAARRLHPGRLRRALGAASCVTQPGRFLTAELRERRSEGEYRLRSSGLRVHIRHPLLDMWVLEEIFRFGAYRPPPAVIHALAGRRSAPLPPRVVDLGGHVGLFGLFISARFPGATIVSFEPEPGNADTLRRTIAANGLGDRWQLMEACAATAEGSATLHSSFHLSRMTPGSQRSLRELQDGIRSVFPFLEGGGLSGSRPLRVRRHDAFEFLTDADLIKIDIEGGEWELLADPRFQRLEAAAIVLEYHPRELPDADARTVVMQTLAGAGYELGSPALGPDGGTVWAWKPA